MTKAVQAIGTVVIGVALLTFGGLHFLTKHATAAIAPPSYINPLPPKLSESIGLKGAHGLTLFASSSNPLWMGKDDSPFTQDFGLVGGLSQIWVSTAAYAQYGSQLQLPLPSDFVGGHKGAPLDVYVHIDKFDSPTSATTFLQSPYNDLSKEIQPPTSVPGTTIMNGRTYTAPNTSNNGETVFVFQWANGDYWNQITVEGDGITVDQAKQVAASLGE